MADGEWPMISEALDRHQPSTINHKPLTILPMLPDLSGMLAKKNGRWLLNLYLVINHKP